MTKNEQNTGDIVPIDNYEMSLRFDGGQTTEICEKQEKYRKGKAVTLTVQSLILYQYPIVLLTFLELY